MSDPAHDLVLGVVADDFTGATDIANTLARCGMRTVMTIGAPRPDARYDDVDALVVALKTRSIPAGEAVTQSLTALDALRQRNARQIVFKYCSTFDSTDAGNIGPVADALRDQLNVPLAMHCPAFPANRRRLFGGYLFVGDVLLSESGMRDHPVTPMRDPNLVRVLQRQTTQPVGLIDFSIVRRGRAAIADALRTSAASAYRHLIVDAVADEDLIAIGDAAIDAGPLLLCGGSGIALGLPQALQPDAASACDADRLPAVAGASAILAGSCSQATRAQIAFAQERFPVFDLNTGSYDEPPRRVAEALAWAEAKLGDRPILVVASAGPDLVAANQQRYGAADAAARVESVLAGIARGLRERGVARFVVAGGETSGAVVEALGVEALRIGPQIDPGVPWTATLDDAPVALALKSGNFGTEDFFVRALQQLS